MTPFLHAHSGGSNDSGFHIAGLSSLDSLQTFEEGGPASESDSRTVTVPDARKHLLETAFVFGFIAILFLVFKHRILPERISFAKTFLAPFSFLNPKFPPPALAPPIA